ncbi:hypothetical protein D1864_11150 [Oceanobacillus picturae]|nr:hypothetical protein D1864_11150 [Oceanobacillus picturae]
MIARISVRNIRRLLENQKTIFCVRCNAVEVFLVLWEEGLGETPECVASGGSPAAHGKRSIFLKRFFKGHSFGFIFYVSTIVPTTPPPFLAVFFR